MVEDIAIKAQVKDILFCKEICEKSRFWIVAFEEMDKMVWCSHLG